MKELIGRLRNDHMCVTRMLGEQTADALEHLTAEHNEAQDCLEAAKGEIVRLAGEATVLRELLAESLSVIKTVEGDDSCESDLLETLCRKIKAAIAPQAVEGGSLC